MTTPWDFQEVVVLNSPLHPSPTPPPTPHQHFPSFTHHPTVCHSEVSTKLSPYRSNIPLKNKTEKFSFKCVPDKKGLILMIFLPEMFELHFFMSCPEQYNIIIFPSYSNWKLWYKSLDLKNINNTNNVKCLKKLILFYPCILYDILCVRLLFLY